MGFLKKLFGGDKSQAQPAAKPAPAVRAGVPSRDPAPPAAAEGMPAAEAPPAAESQDTKQLIRQLGAPAPAAREAAARRLGELKDRSAMRPLMNGYLNYGDPAMLEALAVFGSAILPGAEREALDSGLLGARKARLMDILSVTGSEQALVTVRPFMDDVDLDAHVRACVAAARLGDLFGVDRLADDLRMNDEQKRTQALRALLELDLPRGNAVVEEHVRRYLAQAGAVPDKLKGLGAIEVNAPLLTRPDLNLIEYVTEHIQKSPHTLTVVIGSAAIQMAANRRDAILARMPGWVLHFSIPTMAPEEQIAALLAARDEAAADAEARSVFFGVLPGPHDSPPLPHFLSRPSDHKRSYTVKVLSVDPHEYLLLQDWWHYIEDKSELPTDFEVILAISRPGKSAITEEEHLIYELAPEDQKASFARAYLAHT